MYGVVVLPTGQGLTERGPDLRLLFSELVRLETELWNAVEARLRADFRVTLPVYEFMQVISRYPACRVQDIAAELSITVGGTSKIVDRIEASGYCVRSANPNDRRSSIIALTPTGKRLLPKLTAVVDDELRIRIGAGVPERSLTQLTKTLTRLRSSVRGGNAIERTA
jgi:MarR family transcriptional regulator, organic hydroperoxide resistance regulator